MCMIFACYGAKPSDEVLKAAEQDSSDGAGVAWAPGDGLVHWKRGLTLDEVKETLEEITTWPLVVHFRKASIGAKDLSLTQPFECLLQQSAELEGTTKGKVLFHNGTWTSWRSVTIESMLKSRTKISRTPDMDWNDSRALAYLVGAHGEGLLDVLDWSGRIAILDPEKTPKIQTWGVWEETGKDDKERGYWTSRPESDLFRKGYVTVYQGGKSYSSVKEAEEASKKAAAEGCDGDEDCETAWIAGVGYSGPIDIKLPLPAKGDEKIFCPNSPEHRADDLGTRVFCKKCNVAWDKGEMRLVREAVRERKLKEANAILAANLIHEEDYVHGEAFDMEIQRIIYRDLASRIDYVIGN